jgi:hypothetical protein
VCVCVLRGEGPQARALGRGAGGQPARIHGVEGSSRQAMLIVRCGSTRQPHRQLLLPRLVSPQARAAAAELAAGRTSSRLLQKRAPPSRSSALSALCAATCNDAGPAAVLCIACTACGCSTVVLLRAAVLPPLPHLHPRRGRQPCAAVKRLLPHDGRLARSGGQAHNLRGVEGVAASGAFAQEPRAGNVAGEGTRPSLPLGAGCINPAPPPPAPRSTPPAAGSRPQSPGRP